MTDREKEIRDAERKAMAEVRSWRRKAAKRRAAMTPEERQEKSRKWAEEMRAKGFIVI
jgi:hypothetical protein